MSNLLGRDPVEIVDHDAAEFASWFHARFRESGQRIRYGLAGIDPYGDRPISTPT
ncbi:hypothetical protein ACFV23_18405 [Streptomyces sp. NPDC059627]